MDNATLITEISSLITNGGYYADPWEIKDFVNSLITIEEYRDGFVPGWEDDYVN